MFLTFTITSVGHFVWVQPLPTQGLGGPAVEGLGARGPEPELSAGECSSGTSGLWAMNTGTVGHERVGPVYPQWARDPCGKIGPHGSR